MVHYEPVNVRIDRLSLEEVIINIVVHYYGVSRVNCYESRLAIYIKVLIFVVLLLRNQEEAIYSFSPSIRRSDQETKTIEI